MGNLIGALEVLHKRGLLPANFWVWLDIRDLKNPPNSAGDALIPENLDLWQGGFTLAEIKANLQPWIPDRFIWWWRGSRVLTDYGLDGREQEVIDEFPFFSFLLGDVHPHVLALPFVLLVTALALNILVNPAPAPAENKLRPARRLFDSFREMLRTAWREISLATGGRMGFLIYALAIGGLSFLNTWDFPIYLGVVGLTFTVWVAQRGLNWQSALLPGLIGTSLLGLLGFILFVPFYVTFQSQAGGILPNLWNPTRLPQFVVFFGPFLVAVIALLILLSGQVKGWQRYISWTIPLTVLGPILVLLLAFSGLIISPAGRDYIQGIINNPEFQTVLGDATIGAIVQEAVSRRLLNPWTYLLLGGLLGWGLALLINMVVSGRGSGLSNQSKPYNWLIEKFVLILLLVGLGLPLLVEFVYLRDNFGIRMNTIFKFYFQAWVLLALASAFAVYYVSKQLQGIPAYGWRFAMTVLVLAAMIYPVLATANKTNNFGNEPTLDGIEWISQHYPGDYAAIAWLRQNAFDGSVILEAPGSNGAAYQYTGRVSAMTGLPTLLGWGGHQSQWRGNYDEPARREPDIDLLFNTSDYGQAQNLLDKYGITYVNIGLLERERYSPQGLSKFEQIMTIAFQQDDVTIYRR
jgi:YYY domain-containing protein